MRCANFRITFVVCIAPKSGSKSIRRGRILNPFFALLIAVEKSLSLCGENHVAHRKPALKKLVRAFCFACFYCAFSSQHGWMRPHVPVPVIPTTAPTSLLAVQPLRTSNKYWRRGQLILALGLSFFSTLVRLMSWIRSSLSMGTRQFSPWTLRLSVG